VLTKLDQIVATTRSRIAASKATADLRALEAAAERHQPRGFLAALRSRLPALRRFRF
jgi:indole-3-glycerol phosphate synthase